jgi:hypothetical protein
MTLAASVARSEASTRSSDAQTVIAHWSGGCGWTGNGWEHRPVLTPFAGFSAGVWLSAVEELAKWDAALDA